MNTSQNNASLELAKRLCETVNAAWESGELLEQLTPDLMPVVEGLQYPKASPTSTTVCLPCGELRRKWT